MWLKNKKTPSYMKEKDKEKRNCLRKANCILTLFSSGKQRTILYTRDGLLSYWKHSEHMMLNPTLHIPRMLKNYLLLCLRMREIFKVQGTSNEWSSGRHTGRVIPNKAFKDLNCSLFFFFCSLNGSCGEDI